MNKLIGVLGSGQVARVLANGFLKHGCTVMVGSRDPKKLSDWKAQAGDRGKTGTFNETARFGELLVLAVKGRVAEEVLTLAGIENLSGKTIMDTTNPIADVAPEKGVLLYFTNQNDSLMERLQRAAPLANFVKAFNSVGNEIMVNPQFADGKPTMFICGNNAAAKKEVSEVLDLFGHEAADMGGVEGARAIEPLCMLWCIPYILGRERKHAFKLIRM